MPFDSFDKWPYLSPYYRPKTEHFFENQSTSTCETNKFEFPNKVVSHSGFNAGFK